MNNRYMMRGVSAMKEDVHAAIRNIDKGLYPQAFCKIIPDILGGDPDYCNIMHADGAGTKSSLAYMYWRETGDLSVWKGIAQDALIMNTDDLLCVGATNNILVSSTIGRNKMLIPGEVISAIINGTDELVYSGSYRLTDPVEGSPVNAGLLVLSPTRTYAPVVKVLLDHLRPDIHGMVHCTGGAQTKVLHFVGDNCKVVKDNMFPVPPLFKAIAKESGTDWQEMYKVFNMGHRLEVYLSPDHAQEVIDIARSFNIDAQIVGHIEEGKKSLTIISEFGTFLY